MAKEVKGKAVETLKSGEYTMTESNEHLNHEAL